MRANLVTKTQRGFVVVALGCTFVLGFTGAVAAQTMSFSAYHDAWPSADLSTTYVETDIVDNSSGCVHEGYSTAMTITGGGGPYYADGDLTTVGDFPSGTTQEVGYDITSELVASCSCIESGITFDDYTTMTSVAYLSHYVLAYPGSPNVYAIASDSSKKRCSHTTMRWSERHEDGMTDEGLYYSFGTEPLACNGICEAGIHGTVSGPDAGPQGVGNCDP